MSWVDESNSGRVIPELNHDGRHALRLPRLTPGSKISIAYRLPLRDTPYRSSAAEEGPQELYSDVCNDSDSQNSNADPTEPELTSYISEPETSVRESLEDEDATISEPLPYSGLKKPRGAVELKAVPKAAESLGPTSIPTKSRARRWTRQGVVVVGLILLFIYFYRHGTRDDGRGLVSGLFIPIRINSSYDTQTVNRICRHTSLQWPKGLLSTLSTSGNDWMHNRMPKVTQDEERNHAINAQILSASFSSIKQPGPSSIEDTKVEYQVVGSNGGQVRGERVSQKPLLDWIDHALGWKGYR